MTTPNTVTPRVCKVTPREISEPDFYSLSECFDLPQQTCPNFYPILTNWIWMSHLNLITACIYLNTEYTDTHGRRAH